MPMPTQDARHRPPADTQRVQVLDRAVVVLRAIAAEPQPLNAFELAKLCGLNRTTAWRILITLEHNQLVERDPRTQRYSIGPTLVLLGAAGGHDPLIRAARPTLTALAERLGEQVSLGVPHAFGCTYVDHVQPAGDAHVPRWVGQSGPLHATASGKVFLSCLPIAELDAVLDTKLERFTDRTITSRTRLDAELEAIRRDGFAVGAGEHDALTSAVCAPVLGLDGRLLAIVDVWGPTQRLPPERLRALGPSLVQAAAGVAAKLV